MNQKIIIAIVVLVIIAGTGWFFISQDSSTLTDKIAEDKVTEDQEVLDIKGGAGIPPDEALTEVLFPIGGEELEYGQTYSVQWENNSGSTRSFTIRLIAYGADNRVISNEKIAGDVIVQEKGVYQWKVSQPSYNRYKVEIYPEGGRELVGRSTDFFSIIDSDPLVVNPPEPKPPLQTDNLIVDLPLPDQQVSSPIIITGKARNIFFERQFRVDLLGYDYPLGHPKYAESSRVIISANAKIVGDCDWVRGQWCDFEATINYSSSDTGVENMLYFYDGGQGDLGTPAAPKFIAALSIKLK